MLKSFSKYKLINFVLQMLFVSFKWYRFCHVKYYRPSSNNLALASWALKIWKLLRNAKKDHWRHCLEISISEEQLHSVYTKIRLFSYVVVPLLYFQYSNKVPITRIRLQGNNYREIIKAIHFRDMFKTFDRRRGQMIDWFFFYVMFHVEFA